MLKLASKSCPFCLGLSTPVYFFDHKQPETAEEGIMSHSNEFEANMVVELTR